MEKWKKYLKPTVIIDSEFATITRRAKNLTSDVDDVVKKAKRLFYFVRDKIIYNPYLFTDVFKTFIASNVLKKGEGFCSQKAVLLTALARSSGIPSRLGFVDIKNHTITGKIASLHTSKILPYHGFSEMYINGKWIKATPAFDIFMCKKNRIIPVEFNGIDHAVFHRENQDGKLHIEYTENHGYYDDLPFDEIIDRNISDFGVDYFQKISRL